MNEFKGKKISIIGAARSGLASAIALKQLGAVPFLSESKPKEQFMEAVESLDKHQIDSEFGKHTGRVFDCEYMVTSPGVPSTSEVLVHAGKSGIDIISELELGYRMCKGKVLAITGSNGKTTTTSLIGEIFKHSAIKGEVAGNIGRPFTEVAGTLSENDWAILEVSTFQLEWIDKFKPQVATVLNITPDHLDRHGSMENYIYLKLRVFANQNGTNKSVLNYDDEVLRKFESLSEAWTFSTKTKVRNGCYIDGDWLVLSNGDNKKNIIKIDDIGIKGPHNLSNACAAVSCCVAAGVDLEYIAKGLRSFAGVEHRLERVALIGGVSFINDSKATNVDAVFWALQSVSSPVILIAGGRDKDSDFSTLRDLIKEKVATLVLIGEASDKIESAYDGLTEICRADSMQDAVRLSYEKSGSNGTVLLSPACTSFDMFKNYEHRGEVFKQAVNMLAKEKS